MKALVYHGPGKRAWEEVPKPTIVENTDAIVRVDAVTICGTDLHILEGRCPDGDRRTSARSRSRWNHRSGRIGREQSEARRPRADLLHHVVRELPVLPRGSVRTLRRRGWLDPRPPDRRHAGGIREGSVRGHVDVPRPAAVRVGRERPDACRYRAHGLRGRRPKRKR